MIKFTNEDVKMVSLYLQYIMKKYGYSSLTADQCAELLNDARILLNNTGPKKGFNFRQMLRDGRDGKIKLVTGAYQERPNTRWEIMIVKNNLE
jgi:uncharacterized protein YwgA